MHVWHRRGQNEREGIDRHQSSAGRSFVNLLESLDILEKAAFNASSSGSSSSALDFIYGSLSEHGGKVNEFAGV